MIQPSELQGRRLAMIAWAQNPDGSDNVAVFTGIARFRGSSLIMTRTPPESSFEVPAHLLERIRHVADAFKEMLLNADYSFSVSVGSIDECDESEAKLMQQTGLKWPAASLPSATPPAP
jgi:hypothetical protein